MKHTMSPKTTLMAVSSAVLVLLSGCSTYVAPAVRGDIDRTNAVLAIASAKSLERQVTDQTTGTAAKADQRAAVQTNRPVAMVANRPWLGGGRTQTIQPGEVLPPVLNSEYLFNFDNGPDGPASVVTLATITERLHRITGVPIRVKADVYVNPTAGNVNAGANAQQRSATPGMPAPAPSPLPQPGAQGPMQQQPTAANTGVTFRAGDMKWRGSMAGFLDHLTAIAGLSWSYRDGSVILERYITETFEIAALQSAQNFNFSMSGNSSGTAGGGSGAGAASASSTSSTGIDVTETGKIEAIQSLGRTLTSMLSSTPGSTVTLSEGTGSIIVTTTKDTMARVRQVMSQENVAMLRSVQLQFDIYSVTTTNQNDMGVNWQAITNELTSFLGGTQLASASPTTQLAGAASLSATIVNSGDTLKASSSAMISALSKLGTNVQYRPVSIMAMNRQWARKTNLRQKGYLAETMPSTAVAGGTGGTSGLKSGTVTTGETFAVLPAIMGDGTVVLKFGVGLTDLLGLFDVTSGAGATLQKIQTPEVSGTNDQGTVPLRPGEALVLTGMSRVRSADSATALGDELPIGLGGSRSISRVKEEFVIIVRPVLL